MVHGCHSVPGKDLCDMRKAGHFSCEWLTGSTGRHIPALTNSSKPAFPGIDHPSVQQSA